MSSGLLLGQQKTSVALEKTKNWVKPSPLLLQTSLLRENTGIFFRACHNYRKSGKEPASLHILAHTHSGAPTHRTALANLTKLCPSNSWSMALFLRQLPNSLFSSGNIKMAFQETQDSISCPPLASHLFHLSKLFTPNQCPVVLTL